MRIGFLSTMYPFRGGIAQFSGSLVRALEAEGHEVIAYTFSRQYPEWIYPGKTQYVTDAEKVEKIDSLEILDSIQPLSWKKTARQMQRDGIELLITGYWMPYVGLSMGAVAAQMKKRCTVVGLLHNVVPHERRFLDKRLTRYFLRQHHGFVCMSKAVQQDLNRWLPGKPSTVLPHPIHEVFGESIPQQEARKQLGLPQDAQLVLYFGYIRDYKGLDLLIEAFRNLPDDVHLIIAGESFTGFAGYQSLIDRWNLGHRMHIFNRYILDREVALFYSAADLGALTYKSATQSGVTSVAIHFGLPLVVTDVGGLTELIRHRHNGMVVLQPTPAAIAEAIECYFREALHDQLAERLVQLQPQLTWSHFAGEMIRFCRSLDQRIR